MKPPDYIIVKETSEKWYVIAFDENGIYFENGYWCTWGDLIAMEEET